MNDFNRNKGISIANIFVLTIVIFLISGLYFVHGITAYLTGELQNKIDISAYFKEEVQEQEILDVKSEIIKTSPNIKSIEYVSKEKALAIFNDKHKDDQVLARALIEVGNNPFLPSLNIVTNGDPLQYEQVSNILQTSDFSKLIDRVDFSEKKDIIKKVYSITSSINRFGLILSVVFILIAILVVYNTIKLAIDNSKDEINTMKVVGASDWFIRGPFIISGAVYGVIAFVLCFVLSGIIAYFANPFARSLMPGFSLLRFFLTNMWIFALIQLGFGAGVGVLSSYMVVKKFLNK